MSEIVTIQQSYFIPFPSYLLLTIDVQSLAAKTRFWSGSQLPYILLVKDVILLDPRVAWAGDNTVLFLSLLNQLSILLIAVKHFDVFRQKDLQ